MTMRARLSPLLLGATLAGCITQGPFPSLAQRPDERRAIDEPVRAAPAIANDAALRARIAALMAAVRGGAHGFDTDYAQAERSAARSAPSGSDAWVEAQQALSRIEAARGRTMDALAELHQLALARADLATSAEDLQALDAAIAEAERVSADQQRRVDRLRR